MNPINNVQSSSPSLPTRPAKEPAMASGKPMPAAGKDLPPAPTVQTVERAVKQIKAFLSSTQRQLSFQMDDTSGRTIIRVVNPETGEIGLNGTILAFYLDLSTTLPGICEVKARQWRLARRESVRASISGVSLNSSWPPSGHRSAIA
jgi:hypothetical protein